MSCGCGSNECDKEPTGEELCATVLPKEEMDHIRKYCPNVNWKILFDLFYKQHGTVVIETVNALHPKGE